MNSASTTSTTRTPLRLLHTSDLHIGSDVYPGEAMRGLEASLAQGRIVDADAILIAGDLFDHQRVPKETVKRVMDNLSDCGRPVVVLPGNHDTIFTQRKWSGEVKNNVKVLMEADGETVFFEDLGLAVWGRPVYDHYPGFRPLEGMPARPRDAWYVSMAHGLFMDHPELSGRSSPISPEEISMARCDYIALGHVHAFRDVSQNGVPAYYSGAPSGPSTKSNALVELDPHRGVAVSRLAVE